MLHESKNSENGGFVSFCELVEHPGGSDGGEFPCYERFERDGLTVRYAYGLPSSPTDTFCDESPEAYNCCSTKEYAVSRLELEREELSRALAAVSDLLGALSDPACVYEAYTEDEEPEDDGEDEDEDDDYDEEE